MEDKLLSAWQQLSPEQKRATSWEEGPLLVLAGPGSGKTRVLTCRIARLLESSKDEKFRILALTFTNKAADEMRTRVADLAPGQESRVFLGTFHSFCADVLRQHGVHLGISPNFRIYSLESDLQAVLNEAVEAAKETSEIVSDLDKRTLPVIQNLKANLILPENCRGAFKDASFADRMSIVYAAYEAQLAKRNALDFNSLILRAYQLFVQYPAFARRYRMVYKYVCVDEFQDTNLAQYRLVRALLGENHKNIFAVADDDQVIYQWNGASYKRVSEFVTDYSASILQLLVNFRCPPEIVDLANNLIRFNFLRRRDKLPLSAHRAAGNKEVVRLLPVFDDSEQEAAAVAKDIVHKHGFEPGSVAVLARRRKLLEPIERCLRDLGLAAVISQRKDEFLCPVFVWLHAVLRLSSDRQDAAILEAVCGSFGQLTGVALDPGAVVTQAKAYGRDYLRHWLKLAREEAIDGTVQEILDVTNRLIAEGSNFRGFIDRVIAWADSLAEAYKQESWPGRGLFELYGEERSAWEDLERQITFSLGDDTTLEAFLQELEMRSKDPAGQKDAVTLMTIHSAKGKEFKHVYLVGMVEDELPSYFAKKSGDFSPEMEEERRSCFVAITRAMETLTLSYARRYGGWPKQPSRFLAEMGL